MCHEDKKRNDKGSLKHAYLVLQQKVDTNKYLLISMYNLSV